MPVRPSAALFSCVGAALLGGLALHGCSSSSSSSPSGAVRIEGPAVAGLLCDYTDSFARDVPVTVRGQAGGKTQIDGRIVLPNVTGNSVLVVGDSRTTPTLLVPFTGDSAGSFLERPVHLPSLESGIAANVAATIATVTTISGDALPGVSLSFAAGTQVSNTNNVEVRVVGVSPSRLPVPVKANVQGTGEPRAAYLVEPHQVSFTPAATLRIPMLEPASAGPFDAYRVDTTTGTWTRFQDNVAPVGTGSILSFELSVNEGTLYAVVPRNTQTGVTLSGRIVAGGTPVEGYRASCWNRVSDPTGPDGTFQIQGVPDSYGVFLVRAYPAKPGSEFQPELVLSTSTSTALGDIAVAARPPDRIKPTVRSTSPAAGSTNVSRSTQVTVRFSEAIDSQQLNAFKLVGPKGEVAGAYSFDNPFTVRLRPQQRLDPSSDYQIVVERSVQDEAGNLLDDATINFRFTTQGGTPDPDPTDTLAFGLSPLSGARGDTIQIPGRNYTGGTTVTFGGKPGIVRNETSALIEVDVPGTTPAGDATVSLSAGATSVGSLQPLVLDLRATVATIYSGASNETPLVALIRAQPPAQVVIDGQNMGGTSVTIDGVGIAAIDSTVQVGGEAVATGRTISLPIPAPATLVSGPVVVRGSNGRPSKTYRFIQVKE